MSDDGGRDARSRSVHVSSGGCASRVCASRWSYMLLRFIHIELIIEPNTNSQHQLKSTSTCQHYIKTNSNRSRRRWWSRWWSLATSPSLPLPLPWLSQSSLSRLKHYHHCIWQWRPWPRPRWRRTQPQRHCSLCLCLCDTKCTHYNRLHNKSRAKERKAILCIDYTTIWVFLMISRILSCSWGKGISFSVVSVLMCLKSPMADGLSEF